MSAVEAWQQAEQHTVPMLGTANMGIDSRAPILKGRPRRDALKEDDVRRVQAEDDERLVEVRRLWHRGAKASKQAATAGVGPTQSGSERR